jgi:hypothetical protein
LLLLPLLVLLLIGEYSGNARLDWEALKRQI